MIDKQYMYRSALTQVRVSETGADVIGSIILSRHALLRGLLLLICP